MSRRIIRIRKDGYVSRPKLLPEPAQEKKYVSAPGVRSADNSPPVTYEEGVRYDATPSRSRWLVDRPDRTPEMIIYDCRFFVERDLSRLQTLWHADVQVEWEGRLERYQSCIRMADQQYSRLGAMQMYTEVGVRLMLGLKSVVYVPLFIDSFCQFLFSEMEVSTIGEPPTIREIQQEMIRQSGVPSAQ